MANNLSWLSCVPVDAGWGLAQSDNYHCQTFFSQTQLTHMLRSAVALVDLALTQCSPVGAVALQESSRLLPALDLTCAIGLA